jgi:glycosyltransferase involved in cell wall biosynthesis
VIHFHGLMSSLNLFWLLHSLGKNGPPIIGHYHGGYPSNNRIVRRLQAHNLERLAFGLFTTHEHANPFVESQMLKREQVAELMEVSTAFRRQPRDRARESTGMQGWPVFLWAGRLDPIKDPMVALRGFEIIADRWPDARLYLYYLDEGLLPEMKTYVRARLSLDDRVHFRGRASYGDMEAIYSSADFLLQSSKREFSGYAVLEAMVCGAVPIVTDIPSFRAMTEDGRHGILFPVGDHRELARRVFAFDLGSLVRESEEVQAHFDEALSFRAMAEQLEAVYQAALEDQDSVLADALGFEKE